MNKRSSYQWYFTESGEIIYDIVYALMPIKKKKLKNSSYFGSISLCKAQFNNVKIYVKQFNMKMNIKITLNYSIIPLLWWFFNLSNKPNKFINFSIYLLASTWNAYLGTIIQVSSIFYKVSMYSSLKLFCLLFNSCNWIFACN